MMMMIMLNSHKRLIELQILLLVRLLASVFMLFHAVRGSYPRILIVRLQQMNATFEPDSNNCGNRVLYSHFV